MEGISAAAGEVVPGPERPSPFSQLVYTSNDSYIVHSGDLRKIHKAASRGQVRKLEKMTKRKKTINLNIQDAKRRTALHWACVNGHEEVVTFLVDRKCQLDVLDSEHRTPLMKALQCHREACANILIDSGADLNLIDVYGNTALHYAVYSEILSVVAKLLSHGAVIEVHNKASLTPLLLSITKRSEQIVEFLLIKNANANAVNKYKCTALMLAACHGSSEIVGMLLQQNVDVFAADICGVTAEHYAVTCGFHHIHEQIMEYIRKLSKNHQNTNPEGTSAGTPDEAAPLAERTPDTAESLVEKTPDEAAPLVERTPDTAESLVEKTPDEAASLVEGTSDKIQCLEKATSGKFEQSAEETPREITSPAKETSEKFTWPAKGRPRKIAWEKKDTPREIMSPAKETSEKFTWAAKGRPRKIAWEKKETPVKTGCVARVTSNKTKVLEKGRSKMIACPTKESSTKASAKDQRFPSESKQEEDEEYSCDSRSLFESSAKIQVCIPESIYQKVMEINKEVEEPPKKPSAFKPAIEMQNSVPNKAFELKNEQTLRADPMFPPESKQKDDEENSWDSESLCETVSQKDVCLPKATHQKEIDKINGKLEESPNKDGLLKATCGMKVSILTKALELMDMQTFKAEPPEKPSAFEPAIEMQKSVPNKALELKNEQTLRAGEILPSESKQKDDEENSWDTESLCETVSQKDVCLPKATHQKEIDKINGKLEESPDKDGLLKATCGMKVSILTKALELMDMQTSKAEPPEKPSAFEPAIEMQKSVPNKALELKNEQTLRAGEILPSESKQKDDEENSWDTESLCETVSQKDVCLPKATHQKEIDKINGKLEESPDKDGLLKATCGMKVSILTKALELMDMQTSKAEPPEKPSAFEPAIEMQKSVPNKALELKNEQTLRAGEILPSESKQKDDEENSWDSESLCETVSQKDVCLPKATRQKEIDKINGKLEESPDKDGLLKATCGMKVSILTKALELMDMQTFKAEPPEKPSAFEPAIEMQKSVPNKALELKNEQTLRAGEILPSESKQKDDEENSWDSESLCETVSQKDVCLPKATRQKEIDKINGKLEESPDKDGLLKATCGMKVSILTKALELMDMQTFKAEPPEKPSAFEPAIEMQKSVPNKALELKNEQTLRAGEILPSESKQKDDEENSWDSESLCETVSQKDVCLPKATRQKEIDKINGKLEESPDKDGLLKATCGMKVSILTKALELMDMQTFKAEPPEKPSAFEPAIEMQKSVPNKALELKNEQTLRAGEILPSESKQKDDEENSWDSESLCETVSQKDVCLPKATRQKEIDKINGKLEESPDKDGLLKATCGMKVSILTKALELMDMQTFKAEPPEKPSAFEPATEMQKSVPNKALESKNEQTLRADQMFPSESKQKNVEENSWNSESLHETVSQKDVCLPKATHQKEIDKISGKLEDSTSLSKILDAVHSCERARELQKDHCEQLTGKMEQMKKKFCVLKKKLSEAKEIKSRLENQKVKWEQELCSVRLTLNQEEEKRRNADILNEKIREELGRIEEQHRKELEVKQQLEQALRIQDMELKSVGSNLNQVSHTHENENDLLHENCMLKKEIAMLKLEIATLKHQYQEKENKYFEDIKILKEKNAELRMTLKLKEESLTKRASQYSGQLKVLIAENTILTSKLKEKQDKEILETEIESHHPRLASALQDHDQIVTSRKSQELAFHIAGDACLQRKMNVDVSSTICNNEVLHQPLSEAQRKSKSLKINLNYAGDALRENTLVSEHAQRDQCETQCQMKEAEHMYQNEQDDVNKHTEQQESLDQKLFQLQSKNMWLRQQLVHAHKKADNKSKITIDIHFLERKMQHHLLKEKNEEIFNYNNHLKNRIYQYEKEKAETEVIVRQLQKNLADLNKQCVSEASLEVTSHYHINLKDEIQDLMKK
ncbi:ankyrin repeat domain-containing protein 30A [Pan paniscus]|uniref:ankyrin repeat domain-containing protein 30A n=1 Tax=Pan paniscus TaxID=9597 RepID=UPI002437247B|nr:ankyrin repeat domain-containing protein 30A [Pan paniscus]